MRKIDRLYDSLLEVRSACRSFAMTEEMEKLDDIIITVGNKKRGQDREGPQNIKGDK